MPSRPPFPRTTWEQASLPGAIPQVRSLSQGDSSPSLARDRRRFGTQQWPPAQPLTGPPSSPPRGTWTPFRRRPERDQRGRRLGQRREGVECESGPCWWGPWGHGLSCSSIVRGRAAKISPVILTGDQEACEQIITMAPDYHLAWVAQRF